MQKARRHWIYKISAPTACKRTVSGSISLLCSRFFSPFLHSTGSLSVSQEYLALPDGAGCFLQDFSGPAILRILTRYNNIVKYKTFTLCGLSFQIILLILLSALLLVLQPQNCRNNPGLGSFLFAHHYSGNHYYFLLLRLLRCFSSSGLPPIK